MKIFISFNWPHGYKENPFRAQLGLMSKEEKDLTFNLGLIRENDPKKVFWHSSTPVDIKTVTSEKFAVYGEKGDKIVAEAYNESGETVKQAIIDTNEEWPPNAKGASHVDWSRTY